MISASMVKDLRERTGAAMMACKKALTESNGDMDKAIEILREKGLASAAKKAGRVASEGLIVTHVTDDKKVGSIVEVNCETDFVSANEAFAELANNIAKQTAISKASTVEELVQEKYIADETVTVQESVTALIAKLGENMSVRRFERFTVEKGIVQSYIHGGGRIGVLVELTCEKEDEVLAEVAKDVCLQVAAANPLFLTQADVDQESLDKEREIYKVQALNEGKPENIAEKMVEGRIRKYLKEVCLVDQLFVKDGELTIAKYLEKRSKEIGSEIKIAKFVRFERGEGIEKVEENFAEEVKKQMQQGK
ncbi:MAG: translation elongation factor Ts [Bacillota bacterium]|nr:translation elongation factor Ts [Bacillota bacterium]